MVHYEVVYVTESYDTLPFVKDHCIMYEPLIEAVESKRESTKQSVVYSADSRILDQIDEKANSRLRRLFKF
jgi:ribonuclease BN (tRNA processing enzyme)